MKGCSWKAIRRLKRSWGFESLALLQDWKVNSAVEHALSWKQAALKGVGVGSSAFRRNKTRKIKRQGCRPRLLSVGFWNMNGNRFLYLPQNILRSIMACTRTPNPRRDKVQFFGGVLTKYAPVAQLHQSTAFLQRLLQVGILSGVQNKKICNCL